MQKQYSFILGFTASGTKILYSIVRLMYKNLNLNSIDKNNYFFNINNNYFYTLNDKGSTNKYLQKDLIESLGVGWNHTNISKFNKSLFFNTKESKHVFIHRDIRDILSSLLNSFATNRLDNIYAPSYYDMSMSDMEESWVYMDLYASAWLKHVYDFLTYGEVLLEVKFSDVTADNTGTEYLFNLVNKLAEYFEFKNIDSEYIVKQVQLLNDNSAQSVELSNVPKKVGRYKVLFSSKTINSLNAHFGVGLVLLGYLSLEDFSPFIYKNDSFICLVDDDEDYIYNYCILMFKKYSKRYETKKIDSSFKYDCSSKYIIFSKNNIIKPNKNSIYFPYYELYFDESLKLYSPYLKSYKQVSDLKNKEVLLLIQENHTQLFSFIFSEYSGKLQQILKNAGVKVNISIYNSKVDFDRYDYLLISDSFMHENIRIVKQLGLYRNKLLSIYPYKIENNNS